MSILFASSPVVLLRNVAVSIGSRSLPNLAFSSRSMSRISNKRITRLSSDIEVDQSELKTTGNEQYLNLNLANRNPRNLEQMLLEPKPMGFELDQENKLFWNKVVFEKKSKHLIGKIVHNSGRTLVTASTGESIIAAHLNSSSGLKAAQALGQILAFRTLEAGINSVYCEIGPDSLNDSSNKVSAFISSFEENGIALSEQPFIFSRQYRDQ